MAYAQFSVLSWKTIFDFTPSIIYCRDICAVVVSEKNKYVTRSGDLKY